MSDNGHRVTALDRERLGLELRRAARPFAILLGMLALALACGWIILRNNGIALPWQSTYTARFAVSDAAGVIPNDQTVRINGVIVGRITDVALQGDQAVLTTSMDARYGPIYRNAHARLRPETPLQDLFLDIVDRGTPSAGKLGPNQVLPADQTQTAVSIDDVLNVWNADTRARVKESIDALGYALADHGLQLRSALDQLAPFLAAAKRLTYEFAVRQDATRQLVHNFRLMTDELARRDANVTELVRGGARSLTAVGTAEIPLESVISQLPPTETDLRTAFVTLRAAEDQLDPALNALRPTAAALVSGMHALERFSGAATPAFAALRQPLGPLNALVSSLHPTSSDLARAFTGLRPIAPRLDQITSLIVPCEPAVNKFFQNTDSVGKFYDSRAVIIRGETVLAGGNVQQPFQSWDPSCAPGGGTR